MAELVFSDVRKEFDGGVVAVEAFSLSVSDGAMAVLVGPSGCGKTTLLRMIAGLESLTSGSIQLGGERLDTREPRHRDIAMVFQSYALYPHMTVAGNLSFGLRLRREPRERVREKVLSVARTLEIEPLLSRKPAQLSGGQRQRVALGRAIIREPRVFLFDEPLSNLDARLRGEMRATIRRLHRQLRVTSVYVTHDQVEAMTIGDTLVVMNAGRIHQVGSPEACYDRPADVFVASFLGSPAMNLLEGNFDADARSIRTDRGTTLTLPATAAARIAATRATRVVVGFRPEHVDAAAPATQAATTSGRVVLREPLGHEVLTHFECAGDRIVARGRSGFAEDAALFVSGEHLHLFGAGSGLRIAGAA